MTSKSFALGCRVVFLREKRSEAYMSYGDVSIAAENVALRQEPLQRSWLCQLAGKGDAKI
ncbi:MAG: hypothetical protein U5K77_02955 [Candidatus Saccharibacteria bacterium]|nr:hypothetical protein [Candidatus Saccharibacteria bacterium]